MTSPKTRVNTGPDDSGRGEMARGTRWVRILGIGVIGCALISVLPEPAFGSGGHWGFPLIASSESDISAAFDLPVTGGSHHHHRGHRGVDFLAVLGEEVTSVGDGVVFFSGVISGKPTISIDHGDHLKVMGLRVRSTYEPVRSVLEVGERVRRGQIIGNIASGRSHCNGICLHLGLKVDKDRYVNPELLWLESASLLPSARG